MDHKTSQEIEKFFFALNRKIKILQIKRNGIKDENPYSFLNKDFMFNYLHF